MVEEPPASARAEDVESGSGSGEPHGPLYDENHPFAQHELPPETPEMVDPALRLMREALQTQIIPHVGGKLLEPVTDQFLLRFLRASKYDGKRAAALHGAYWRFRLKHFGAAPLACAAHARARDALRTGFVELPLGARDRDGRQLIVIRPARIDAESAPLTEAVWYVIERAIAASDATQRQGVIALVDCRGMSVARNVRPAALRFLLTSLREHMPLRLGGVLVARPAAWLRHVWSAVGWLVKAKIRERVVVVDSVDDDVAPLATWLEPEAIPTDMGGRLEHDHATWLSACFAADDAPAESAASARAPSSTPSAQPDAEETAGAAAPSDEVADGTIHIVMSEASGGAAPAPSGGGGGLRDSGPIVRVEPASPLASGGDAATPDAAAPAADAESAAASAEPDESWLVAVDLVKQMRSELTPGGERPVPIPPGAKAPHHDAAASRETRLTRDLPPCVRAQTRPCGKKTIFGSSSRRTGWCAQSRARAARRRPPRTAASCTIRTLEGGVQPRWSSALRGDLSSSFGKRAVGDAQAGWASPIHIFSWQSQAKLLKSLSICLLPTTPRLVSARLILSKSA